MVKILILNVGNSNKGTLALNISIKGIIKKYFIDPKFSFMGIEKFQFDGKNVSLFIGYSKGNIGSKTNKMEFILKSFIYLFICLIWYIFNKIKIKIPISKSSLLYPYYNSDIIINTGGDHFSGEYGLGVIPSFLNILYPILLGKSIVLFGESLGYFRNPILEKFAIYIFNKTRLILVRDRLSYNFLEKNKIKTPKYLTADPAFLLEPIPETNIEKILINENIIFSKGTIIGINASGLMLKFVKNHELLVNLFVNVIDYLIENKNANILLIPHVYSVGIEDDRNFNYLISNRVKNKHKLFIIKNEYGPKELKGLIGVSDLFIGSRMHTLVASTSLFIPTIGIAYSHKTHGIIGNMVKQDKYIIDIKDLDYDTFISKINDAWENKNKIRKNLQSIIPEIKKQSLFNGELLKEYLEDLINE